LTLVASVPHAADMAQPIAHAGDDEATAAVAPHLLAGEKLLWSGRPTPALYAWNNGAGLLVVAVMLAFGSVTVLGVLGALGGLALALAIGLVLRRKATTVRYGLTNARAIIVWSWPWPGKRAIPVQAFNICLIDGDDKAATTILFRKGWSDAWWGRPFEIDAFIGVVPSRADNNLAIDRGQRTW
jgi:hypothetical protein